MVFHSKVSGVISLPRCIRISMLELSNGPVLHKSVYIIGVGYLCGILIRIHRYAGCDPGFLRGDPFPLWIGPPLSRRPYIGHTYPIPFFSLFCESTRSSGRCVSSSVTFFLWSCDLTEVIFIHSPSNSLSSPSRRNQSVVKVGIYGCRYNQRLKSKTDGSTRLTYTGCRAGLEHLNLETRLRDERFESVKGEYVI